MQTNPFKRLHVVNPSYFCVKPETCPRLLRAGEMLLYGTAQRKSADLLQHRVWPVSRNGWECRLQAISMPSVAGEQASTWYPQHGSSGRALFIFRDAIQTMTQHPIARYH